MAANTKNDLSHDEEKEGIEDRSVSDPINHLSHPLENFRKSRTGIIEQSSKRESSSREITSLLSILTKQQANSKNENQGNNEILAH